MPLPVVGIMLVLGSATAAAELVVTEGTNLAVDVSPTDGRVAMDLLGSIWVLPARGGDAERLTEGGEAAARPRWSPDGTRILYQSKTATGARIRVHELADTSSRSLGDGGYFDQHPAWHPDGQRIVYSSERRDSGFDLWEMDVPTGLSWRLTHHPGDETEPAWSDDGRHLVYVRRVGEQWRLVLRRYGRPEVDVVVSDEPLAAPAWRPDGSILTFLRRTGKRYALQMAILSNPPIIRTLAENQDFFLAPGAWVDRLRFLYTADGVIKSRGINDWKAREVRFRAAVAAPESGAAARIAARELPVVTPPRNRLVIRAARLFDGVEPTYRDEVGETVRRCRADLSRRGRGSDRRWKDR